MNPRSLRWLPVVCPTLVVGVLAMGCGSAQDDVATRSGSREGANGSSNEEDAPDTLEAFYREYTDLSCQRSAACYGFTLPTNCDWDELWFESYYGPKAANLVYHRAEAAKCLAVLRQSDCGDLDQVVLEACLGVVEGPGKANDSCTGSIDCGLELYCNKDAQCPGVCQARTSAGEDCNVSPCKRGLTCASGVCSEPAQEGADCSTLECGDGLSCSDDVCKPYAPYRQELGESCESSTDCYGVEYCDLETNKCVRAGREGDECDVVPCHFEYYCAESVCRARKSNGETCAERLECESYTCIDGQCEELRDIGEECTGPLDCRTATCGEDGTCLPLDSCE
jgi:hypothetical protein